MNKNLLKVFLCGCCLLPAISGCTSKAAPAPVPPGAVEDVFSRNARLISEEMVLLMGASAPESVQAPALAPLPRYAAIDKPLQIVWHGALSEGVQLVASKIDFKAEVYGATPASPIVVDSMNRGTAQDILQQFGVQSGERANIIVDIPARTIRVVYASFVGKPEPKIQPEPKRQTSKARSSSVKTTSSSKGNQTKKSPASTKKVLPNEKQPVVSPPAATRSPVKETPAVLVPEVKTTPPAVPSPETKASSAVVPPVPASPPAPSIKMDAIEEDVTISFPSDEKKPASVNEKQPSPPARTPARRPSSKDDDMANLLQSLDEGR